jgi:hypothetical protein
VALKPSSFAQNAKIVQIDIDRSEINKNVETDHHIIGDAKRVLELLLERLDQMDHSEWKDYVFSFKTETGSTGENLKGKGSQNNDDYVNETTYYWNGTTCSNSKGDTLDPAAIFVSLQFKGVTRNADGTWSLGDFLKIKEGTVHEGVGTTGESTPSPKIELVPDLAHNYGDSWVNTDPLVHWQECECGDKAHIGEHTFEYVIDKEPTETEVGYRHRECTVCGYKKATVEIQPTGTQTPPVVEEPATGIQAIIQMIVEFFQQIVEWFKGLFVGEKK